MEVRKYDNSRERQILTAMVVDATVLNRISSKWDAQGLFNSRWSNLVGKWCVEYVKKYDKAPGKTIQRIFSVWAEKNKDREITPKVEEFLESLSDDYTSEGRGVNPLQVIDLADAYFDRVRMVKTAESILADIDNEDLDKARQRYESFKTVGVGAKAGVDFFQDVNTVKTILANPPESLIEVKGALGNFFGTSLGRGCFVSFVGPDKTGKTFWLMELSYLAMLQRRRVAFFEVGDMSEPQIYTRIATRNMVHPIHAKRWPYKVKIPTRIIDPVACVVKRKTVTFDKPPTEEKIWASYGRVAERVKSKKVFFKIQCHATSTVSVKDIDATLTQWSNEGWNADVVVIDYADILLHPSTTSDYRHQVNSTWEGMRSLSLKRDCLVLTATQSDAGAYNQSAPLSRKNFSEDKRKNAHCTAMYGINVSPREKDAGVCRLNHVVLREDRFSLTKCVHVAGCLALANPAVLSAYPTRRKSNGEEDA